MQKEKIRQKQKGITLIALIITIIVMLILVGVSVTVALNGGLFRNAQDATGKTQTERDKELALDSKRVKVNGTWYDSMEDYIAGRESENQEDIGENAGGGSEGETVATGTPIGSTDALKAKQVKVGDLVYVANSDGETATVYGYKADVDDYSTGMLAMNAPNITANSIKIDSKVQIGEKVYTVNTIGNNAFAGMMSGLANLNSVSIPDSVTKINGRAFYNCAKLSQITDLSNVTTIEPNAFTGTLWDTAIRGDNNGLLVVNGILFDGMNVTGDENGNVIIPGTVSKIASGAFLGIMATSITIPSTVTTVESNAIGSMTNTLTTINVSWAEGNKPEGWADDWNKSNVTPTYSYNPQS